MRWATRAFEIQPRQKLKPKPSTIAAVPRQPAFALSSPFLPSTALFGTTNHLENRKQPEQ